MNVEIGPCSFFSGNTYIGFSLQRTTQKDETEIWKLYVHHLNTKLSA
jgi:hypothetical protein